MKCDDENKENRNPEKSTIDDNTELSETLKEVNYGNSFPGKDDEADPFSSGKPSMSAESMDDPGPSHKSKIKKRRVA